ncbi:uncharacterized protein GGS22DRAFT_197436 [Annulohypoxylon maeteangense]|uniref:uncharacterized protein n=1 Tax=Annulohypoxylon maeteangense TaxID=1927788 RepID=UPI00200857D8|nr:uncharacterized protein GGS22DRAFT_197436 [Annulohypoxylon maeteangense]KAI0880712.1 hypothetical protein GGS22DRAFT_197436 [Annulohypoxylon maeteangense]
MASVGPSPTTSSSSISEDSHDLSLELQPAPLRLPRRRTDANFDGSNSVDHEHTSTTEDDLTDTVIHKDIIPHPPQAAITKAPSQCRPPAPKLGSLVSKFEILDAVNSTESISAFKIKPNGIPRGQATLVKTGSSSKESKNTTFIQNHNLAKNPADLSPRQIVSPPPIGNRSKLPVSTLFKSMIGDHSPEAVSRSQKKDKEIASAEGEKRPPKKQDSPTRDSQDDYSNDLSHDTNSQAGRRPG